MSWAVAVTVPGREQDVQHRFAEREQLYGWFPVGERYTKPRKKHAPVKIVFPVFRGYMFLPYEMHGLLKALNDPSYQSVGLLGYIQVLDNIFELDDVIVQDLRRRQDAGEFDAIANRPIPRKTLLRGDKVLIQDGILGNAIMGKQGVIAEDAHNKKDAWVLLGHLRIKIPVSFLEKITDKGTP